MANFESNPESAQLDYGDKPGNEGKLTLEVPDCKENAGAKTEAIEALVRAVRDPDLAGKGAKHFPWWLPSMSDLFILAFYTWAFLTGANGWLGLLTDADSGWHIRTGEVILKTHTIPTKDLFSFSKPGADWYAWEWLTDILWAKLYGVAGLKGICWFAAVIITGFTAILLRFSLWMGAGLFISLTTVLVAAGASSVHFLARPHVFTLLLLPISVWLIEADRRNPTWRVFLIIPLVTLWANLHGGFPSVLLVLAAAAVGCAVEAGLAWPDSNWRPSVRYAFIAVASLAASVVNPYGIRLHQHMLSYLTSDWIKDTVDEFRSPNFRGESMMQFEGLLFLGLLVAASRLRQKKVVEALWIIGFGHMALTSVRHVTVFAAVVTPYLAAELTGWWRSASSSATKYSLAGIVRQMDWDLIPSFHRTTFWLPLLLILSVFLPVSMAHWPSDYPKELFPTTMVAKHQNELAKARVFTTDQWADYLIFRSYPVQRIFVDGRSDFFGPEIGNQCLQLLQGQSGWQGLLDKHRFEYVLAPLSWPLTSLLRLDARWKVVEEDEKVILFQRITAGQT